MVYADNAATTKISTLALNEMVECMNNLYGNPSSLHTLGQIAKAKLETARQNIATVLNADAKDIYFTSGGSEADNQAIISAAMIGKKKNKNHIISTKIEHHAVLHTLDKLKKEGFDITLLDVDEYGTVDIEQLKNAITPQTILVSVMAANNEIGTIEPIKEIGQICKDKGILFHTDAVQGVGHIPINVKNDNIDMLSLSAHKFHGPRGIGVLYARKGIQLTNIISGGAQERGKRAGTENLPAICGMAVAMEQAVKDMPTANDKIKALKTRLVEGLSKIPHSKFNGKLDGSLAGTINFCFEGVEGESLLLLLDEKGIEASSGSACASGSLSASHVLLAIGLPQEVAHGSLRLSINEENTMEEMEYIIKSVKEVVNYLRDISPVWESLQNGSAQHLL